MKMPCGITCFFALVIIVSKIIMTFMVSNDKQIGQYARQFSPEAQSTYKRIVEERLSIYLQGYTLGFILSIFIILYNTQVSKQPMSASSMICMVIVVSFLVSYFYYVLTPKSDWMINHIKDKKDISAWLNAYRSMQFYYHSSFVAGLLGVGLLAFSFRGSCKL